MKILFCQWDSICEYDMDKALVHLGHQVKRLVRKINSVDYDKEYLKVLSEHLLKEQYDIVFSVNYIPIIARVCKVFHTLYLSWTVDSPLFQFYSDTIHYDCNRIFCFDQTLYQEFVNENLEHIFHMPLAANVNHLNEILPTKDDVERFSSEISFVGSLYTEKCKYNEISNMPDYLKGYVDGLIEAQLKIYGYNFIQDVLPEDIVAALKSCIGWLPLGEDYKENDRAIVAQEYIGIKCSEIERKRMLAALSKEHQVKLYTLSDSSELTRVTNMGPAHSRVDMPKIFKCSKINLNITAKTIRSGLSQRIFDVMGAGGFLITNYQAELPNYFDIGKDLVVYDSEADLLQKCDYYLNHEQERVAIARSGYEKVKKYHTFELRFEKMIQML